MLHLSQQLFKALDFNYYQTLVIETDWEQYFKFEWKKKGEVIIRIDEEPDGVYYIESGEALVENGSGEVIATLTDGDIFGEMAYFSAEGVRNANVKASTDLVVRKISGEDFEKFPIIKNIFQEIAMKRSHREKRRE